MPESGLPDAIATGGVFGVPVGITNRVILCGGKVRFTVEVKLKSESRLIRFAAVNLINLGSAAGGEDRNRGCARQILADDHDGQRAVGSPLGGERGNVVRVQYSG